MGRRFAVVVVPTFAVLVACSGAPEPEMPSDEPVATEPAPESVAVEEADPEPVLIVDDLAGFSPRSVVFANVEFTVTGVRISNQQLRSYASGGDPVIDEQDLFAYLDVTAVNRMSTTMTERLDPGHYKLEVGGRQIDAADELGFLSDLTGFIRANSGVDSFLAFRIDEGTDLTDAVLVIGRAPDRRASLPLLGDVPAPVYPIEVELVGSAVGTSPTNPGTIEFTVLGATLAEDVPHERATSPTGHRADEDELFLVIHLRAEKISGGGPDSLGPGTFRLIVDGVPRAPWDTASAPQGSQGSPTVAAGAAEDVWVAFMLDVDASELVLQAGDFTAEPALIELDLPPLA